MRWQRNKRRAPARLLSFDFWEADLWKQRQGPRSWVYRHGSGVIFIRPADPLMVDGAPVHLLTEHCFSANYDNYDNFNIPCVILARVKERILHEKSTAMTPKS